MGNTLFGIVVMLVGIIGLAVIGAAIVVRVLAVLRGEVGIHKDG